MGHTRIATEILLKIFLKLSHRPMPTWYNTLIRYQSLTSVPEKSLAKVVWILHVKMDTKVPSAAFVVQGTIRKCTLAINVRRRGGL